jgi:hypothetical protein
MKIEMRNKKGFKENKDEEKLKLLGFAWVGES